MGFGWEDIYNPFQQTKDVVNKISTSGVGGGSRNTYHLVRGADGTPQYVPTSFGEALAQQTGEAAPLSIDDAGRQALLAQQGSLAGKFANQAQQGYNAYGQQGNAALAQLQAQAQGQNSVSAEQLRQNLGQLQSQQMSMAAGASPRNAAMAARTAQIQSGRLGYGMSGQQALAGLQERNQAMGQYANLLQGLRGQDLNAALTSRQTAETGYGAGMTGAPQKTWIETYGPAIQGGLSAIAASGRSDPNQGGAAASDRRLKTSIRDADADMAKAATKIPAFAFRYKNERYGAGEQKGVMAQDLEKVGLGHAVVDTPRGKMVHGAKLATSNTAMIGALARRLAKLEGAAK